MATESERIMLRVGADRHRTVTFSEITIEMREGVGGDCMYQMRKEDKLEMCRRKCLSSASLRCLVTFCTSGFAVDSTQMYKLTFSFMLIV